MTPTRPYVVTDNTSGEQRLVSAANPARALRHVCDSRFHVEAASANDVLALIKMGVKPEEAKTAPADDLAPEPQP